jgi:hypothetical protein
MLSFEALNIHRRDAERAEYTQRKTYEQQVVSFSNSAVLSETSACSAPLRWMVSAPALKSIEISLHP